MEQHIFSVTELNQTVKLLLDNEPLLQNVFIRGELSNYKMHPTGHHYFSLKDQGGVLNCVMFAGNASKLRFRPENGMRAILQGRVSAFPKNGSYQLYVTAMTPEGAGDLALAFEQLKKKLYAQGLFDPAHKKPLPRYPEKIAVITAASGAAVHDMIRILNRRYPMARILIMSVHVQGERAPAEIAGAIRYANRWKIGDLIITGRGGGSMEDLWAFNDEGLARAIYESELPVISAVGHEPDVTIADYVADVRASTPSNAAEIAVPDQAELLRWLQGAKTRLDQTEAARLKALRRRLEDLAAKRVLRDQLAYVQDKRMELAHVQRRMGDLAGRYLLKKAEKFSALAAALDAMSPLKVLSRGYAVVRDGSGKILRSYRDTETGAKVTVSLGEGGLACTVDVRFEKEAGGHEQQKDGNI